MCSLCLLLTIIINFPLMTPSSHQLKETTLIKEYDGTRYTTENAYSFELTLVDDNHIAVTFEDGTTLEFEKNETWQELTNSNHHLAQHGTLLFGEMLSDIDEEEITIHEETDEKIRYSFSDSIYHGLCIFGEGTKKSAFTTLDKNDGSNFHRRITHQRITNYPNQFRTTKSHINWKSTCSTS